MSLVQRTWVCCILLGGALACSPDTSGAMDEGVDDDAEMHEDPWSVGGVLYSTSRDIAPERFEIEFEHRLWWKPAGEAPILVRGPEDERFTSLACPNPEGTGGFLLRPGPSPGPRYDRRAEFFEATGNGVQFPEIHWFPEGLEPDACPLFWEDDRFIIRLIDHRPGAEPGPGHLYLVVLEPGAMNMEPLAGDLRNAEFFGEFLLESRYEPSEGRVVETALWDPLPTPTLIAAWEAQPGGTVSLSRESERWYTLRRVTQTWKSVEVIPASDPTRAPVLLMRSPLTGERLVVRSVGDHVAFPWGDRFSPIPDELHLFRMEHDGSFDHATIGPLPSPPVLSPSGRLSFRSADQSELLTVSIDHSERTLVSLDHHPEADKFEAWYSLTDWIHVKWQTASDDPLSHDVYDLRTGARHPLDLDPECQRLGPGGSALLFGCDRDVYYVDLTKPGPTRPPAGRTHPLRERLPHERRAVRVGRAPLVHAVLLGARRRRWSSEGPIVLRAIRTAGCRVATPRRPLWTDCSPPGGRALARRRTSLRARR